MSISIDIDIDDILYGMNKWDRKQLFEALQEDGYISKSCIITNDGEVKASAHVERNALDESKDEFNQALQLLWNNGWKLTKEQEDYIINLSKRF